MHISILEELIHMSQNMHVDDREWKTQMWYKAWKKDKIDVWGCRSWLGLTAWRLTYHIELQCSLVWIKIFPDGFPSPMQLLKLLRKTIIDQFVMPSYIFPGLIIKWVTRMGSIYQVGHWTQNRLKLITEVGYTYL